MISSFFDLILPEKNDHSSSFRNSQITFTCPCQVDKFGHKNLCLRKSQFWTSDSLGRMAGFEDKGKSSGHK